MIAFSTLLSFLVAGQFALGSPLLPRLDYDYAVKETHTVPIKWTEAGNPHPLQPLKLNIGLQPSNFDTLKQHLHEGKLDQAWITSLPANADFPSVEPRPPPLWPASVSARCQKPYGTIP